MTSHTTIAIVVALPEERRYVLKPLEEVRREKVSGFPLFRCRKRGRDILVIESGMGGDNARRAAEAVVNLCNPSVIVSIGFGGGLSPSLQVGDVILGTRCISWVNGSHCGEALLNTRLPDPYEGNIGRKFGLFEGSIVSTHTAVDKQEIAARLPAKDAAIVDMETFTLASFSFTRNIPLIAIRAVSDPLGETLLFSLDDITRPDGRISIPRIMVAAFMKPAIIPQLCRLGANAAKAGRSISDVLENILSRRIFIS